MILLILALMAPADHQGDRAKPPALEEDRAFEGTWELASEHYGLKRLSPVKRRLVVEDGAWREEFDGRIIPLIVRRKAAQRWPLIDRTRDLTWKSQGMGITGGGMIDRQRGIYHLSGDTLTVVIGSWRGSPPDGLEPAPGRTVEVWRRVRCGE